MSLKTKIDAWRIAYDEYEIDVNHDPNYIGSICDVNDNYHTGNGIYDTSVSAPNYSIYDFKWYAGQGVDHVTPGNGGGKFLVGSADGFSWDTTYNAVTGYSFETEGDLNCLYLGTTPEGDDGPAPAYGTLTAFDPYSPLIVIKCFNVAVDWVAANVFGAPGDDGNTQFSAASLVDGNNDSILANAGMYDKATLNSAVLYSLAFDNTNTQAFEFILDKYLESIGSDITDCCEDIALALANAESCLSISCYEFANDYAEGGVIPCDDCDCDCNTNDLLLAA